MPSPFVRKEVARFTGGVERRTLAWRYVLAITQHGPERTLMQLVADGLPLVGRNFALVQDCRHVRRAQCELEVPFEILSERQGTANSGKVSTVQLTVLVGTQPH